MTMGNTVDTKNPSLMSLFLAWLKVGFASFGGGVSTMSMIQRVFVHEKAWISDFELVRENAIAQIAPGINILALTILIGKRVCHAPGIAVSLLGLLIPSAGITIVMTAAYATVRHLQLIQAALRGVVPATIGIGLVTAFSLGKALMASHSNGVVAARIILAVAVMLPAAILVSIHVPVIMVLCGGGVLGAISRSIWPSQLSEVGKTKALEQSSAEDGA